MALWVTVGLSGVVLWWLVCVYARACACAWVGGSVGSWVARGGSLGRWVGSWVGLYGVGVVWGRVGGMVDGWQDGNGERVNGCDGLKQGRD